MIWINALVKIVETDMWDATINAKSTGCLKLIEKWKMKRKENTEMLWIDGRFMLHGRAEELKTVR